MRITKYPQSCLLVEDAGGRILIDPGNFAMQAYEPDDFGELHAVLYTHRHADHFVESAVASFVDSGADIYTNADVAELIGDAATTVDDGDSFETGGFSITARDLPHVPLVDGEAGPPNTGFVIDLDDGRRFFHPGDGIELAGLKVDVLGLPIAGPSISFRDAYLLIEQTGAETAVPMHYDMFSADPELFAQFCDIAEVVSLEAGESAEI